MRAGHFPPGFSAAPFKLDEGYSDDTRSQTDNDAPLTDAVPLPDWILACSESDRAGWLLNFLFYSSYSG